MFDSGHVLFAVLASHDWLAALLDPILLFLLAALGIVALGLLYAFISARERQKRRPSSGVACKQCGYDLRGNVSGICPECGTIVPEGARQRLTRADDKA